MKKTLKLLSLLLSITAITIFSSCSKDSEDLIVGKWVEYKNVMDLEYIFDGDQHNQYNNVVHDDIDIIYNFYEDGTCDMGGLFSGTWSISEDTLFCSLWGIKNHIILELTSSDMVLHTVNYGSEKSYASYFRRK